MSFYSPRFSYAKPTLFESFKQISIYKMIVLLAYFLIS
ncbi:hypothetical protein LEP1GSC059_2301 [Leptospira noguchii serovar Panama str. CZ214]|uniref:Uncharacterized protein n=1 Tax=Leptospira noguchii serovar Panama str. CZ214 TaxID=1001595 RepID=T0GKV4_9LEPT|nr:hypothetical protein LEP1GSC059_2301 [Leptospira noguchii serovar Panama str. CZ214]